MKITESKTGHFSNGKPAMNINGLEFSITRDGKREPKQLRTGSKLSDQLEINASEFISSFYHCRRVFLTAAHCQTMSQTHESMLL